MCSSRHLSRSGDLFMTRRKGKWCGAISKGTEGSKGRREREDAKGKGIPFQSQSEYRINTVRRRAGNEWRVELAVCIRQLQRLRASQSLVGPDNVTSGEFVVAGLLTAR